jgi:2-dehydropantoate 2-reductase
MRIAVVGIGGVGGLLGGLLARAGEPVTFVARGEHYQTLRESGIRVRGSVGDFEVLGLDVVEYPRQVAGADAVLLGVKTWQVQDVAAELKGSLSPDGFVVPTQNGVEAPQRIAEALGSHRAVIGLCHMLSWLEGPGRIVQQGHPPRLTLGELGAKVSDRLRALEGTLRRAGIECELHDDARLPLWEKFLYVTSMGAVGAVTRVPVGQYRHLPESRALLEGATAEILRLAQASGVPLAESARQRSLERIDWLPPDATVSMQRDILEGKPSELRDQVGAAVRIGRRLGVPTPTFDFLLGSLQPQERAARRELG